MKNVKNTSMQGLYVMFETPEGPRQRFVASKATIEVPSFWGGRAVDNLLRRRMIKVTEVAPPVPTPQPPKKTIKKSK
tara:strand:- start:222 stop:452 length:231 start_codon:yes stop_codon:yes gene_type:complete